jgi:Tfp pilus assembly protein PilE
MKSRSQQGIGLIEVLIVLALLVIVTAMIGQAGQSLIQAQNEKNISASLLQIQAAQGTYLSTYSNGYASMADLSACPDGGSATKTAACLISPGLTNGNPIYNYEITASTPTDSPTCATAPCGFLVVAVPKSASFGRMSYCVTSLGLLHGEVTHTLNLTTNAACEALPVISAGTPSVPPSSGPTAYTTGVVTGTGSSCCGDVITLTGAPAGTYVVTAQLSGILADISAGNQTLPQNQMAYAYGSCALSSGTQLGVTNWISPAGPVAPNSGVTGYINGSLSGVVTLTAGQSLQIACAANTEFQGNQLTVNYGKFSGSVTAVPVQSEAIN